MITVLFNAKADAGEGEENARLAAKALEAKYGEAKFVNLIGLDVPAFFKGVEKGEKVVIAGGDGTLNHFINDIGDVKVPEEIYLLPVGTGNDFLNDVKDKQDEETKLVPLHEFITNLPIVEVKGKKYRFINGIGFGIDGECCVKADELKAQGKKNLDYGKITINLLLFHFKAPNATIKVDGEEMKFKKTWIAASMNGRCYGGGMLVAPEQKRGSGLLSFVAIHGKGRIGTLMIFPKLFKGTHVENKKNVTVKTGKLIEVTFDRPTGLQIDGEVVKDVTSYKAYIA
ncbi:MAG: diacylglycerol kinase family protein [Bacilli bacterium]|nr:diacylglycerol kinase family protein [Bacilli bacterium]